MQRYPKDFPDPANRRKRVLEVLPVATPAPPKQLTLEEIKAENLQYRRALNLLKVHLLPIMEQIKRKYRVFRNPFIPQSKYQYLFDEADPNYVRPDVPNAPPRPYEIGKDAEGTPGIIDTSTKKFLYNLDTVTIETRLANTYYITPEAFLKDVRSFVADSEALNDHSSSLKANEMYANVEVDVTNAADSLRARFDFEEEWKRELFRQKEYKRIQKELKKGQSNSHQPQPNVANGANPPPGGHPPKSQQLHTTAGFEVVGDKPASNGENSRPPLATNGTSVPSRAVDEDVAMTEAGSPAAGGPNYNMQPPRQWPPMGGHNSFHTSTRGTIGSTDGPRSFSTPVRTTMGGTSRISQVSAVQSLPAGVSPSALLNDASTTKTPDPSTRSSHYSTQATNGTQHDQSSIPDTQEPISSQLPLAGEQWAHSQAQGILQGIIQPLRGSHIQASPAGSKSSYAPSMANLLNDPDTSSQLQRPIGSSASQQLELDEGSAEFFLEQLTERTSGCTIEQLQQIYREMMVELWKTRGEHNRNKVLTSVTRVFNEAIKDIESMQDMFQQSQSQ